MAASESSLGPKVSHTKLAKREPSKRIFVNRSLMLEKVKFFGFDMDYTLADNMDLSCTERERFYKSPEYESLGFNLLKERMVDIGYPEAILDFQYDPTFPIRGLWFDSLYGNLLKADPFGNILVCVHGFQFLKGQDIQNLYPNKFAQRDERRFRIFNTLYELPLIYILACLVDFFSNDPKFIRTKTGVKCGDLTMTFKSIYQDVGDAMAFVHQKDGPLKSETVKNVSTYVVKDERLPIILDRLRANGSKVFLATNSDYTYSNAIMSYMLNETQADGTSRDWVSYFDYVVVDAKKPLFFGEGTIMRQVNRETGALRIGSHTGPVQPGQVYAGGSVSVLSDLIGSLGEVLYVGDHIFGDILKSKKAKGWRTFLVVPEISEELQVWTDKTALFDKLAELDKTIGDLYLNLDSSCVSKPNITQIQASIRETNHEVDMAYGILGSVFRSGSRQTFFGGQVMRFADLYGASFFNMVYYPLSYVFRAPHMLMPHESTVGHDPKHRPDKLTWASRARTVCGEEDSHQSRRERLTRTESLVPNLFADTPREITQIHENHEEDFEVGDNKQSSDESDTETTETVM